jgi:hypothetical protein
VTREFIYVKKFDEKWNKLGLTDNDLIPLEEYLLEKPNAGVVVKGTGGLRKLRWKLPDTGKSDGVRVAYIDVVVREKVYMLDLFPNNEKDNYSDAERNALKQLVNELKKESK